MCILTISIFIQVSFKISKPRKNYNESPVDKLLRKFVKTALKNKTVIAVADRYSVTPNALRMILTASVEANGGKFNHDIFAT